MAFDDLRQYIHLLESEGELARVAASVSPRFELAAISRVALEKKGPALLFERVEGSGFPVVCNLLTTRRRVALALGCSEEELLKTWLERTEKKVFPELVSTGPCKEVISDAVDLEQFPVPIWWNKDDGGPYITFGLFICKDPETGLRNVAIYRVQIKGKNRSGVLIQPPQHGGICFANAEKRDQPLEFALALGAEPVCYLAAQALLTFEEDEFVLASSLRQEPLPLVKCETVDLEVPASSEIVLEGHMLPGAREMEGPFGEFTGYLSGRAPRPVAEYHCITHRQEPIYLTAYEGYRLGTSTMLLAVSREPEWFRWIRSHSCPSVKDVHFTPAGCGTFHAVVSIRKQVEGQAKNVIADLLRSHTCKHVIVVDDDIDPRDPSSVEWALATRFQADRDLVIIPGAAGIKLDPSQTDFPTGVGAKMGLDATRPLFREFPALADVPEEFRRKVEKEWEDFGFIKETRSSRGMASGSKGV